MYRRARENNNQPKANINKHVIKKQSQNPFKIKDLNAPTSTDNNQINKEKQKYEVKLPKITNQKNNNINNKINESNNKKQSSLLQNFNNNIKNNNSQKRSLTGNKIKNPPVVELRPFQRNRKMMTVKKRFIVDNSLYTIIAFLDCRSVYFFMLVCKRFYKLVNECDDVWYSFYIKKFCKPPSEKITYEINRGHWKQEYAKQSTLIYEKNYATLKNKYLSKYKKNIYTAKKDPYYLTNNLYKNLKNPLYAIEVDKTIYKVKYILTNKILSHINFFTNFDQKYQDLNKIKCIKLLFTEQSIGIFRKPVVTYNIKKNELKCSETDGITNKICKIYYDKDLIFSTFDKNFIFFINISLPVCKLCENIFDFINGIHTKNLNYACDCDSKFGLYDYSLLINLKSWNKIYFSLTVNTCDLKDDDQNFKNDLYYIDKQTIVCNDPIKFDIKSLVIKDAIYNFMIFDIMFLTYNGDHVLCDSKPVILKEDKSRIDYDEYDSKHYIGIVNDKNYYVKFNFNINEDKKYHALIGTEIRVNKNYIESIFKKF